MGGGGLTENKKGHTGQFMYLRKLRAEVLPLTEGFQVLNLKELERTTCRHVLAFLLLQL